MFKTFTRCIYTDFSKTRFFNNVWPKPCFTPEILQRFNSNKTYGKKHPFRNIATRIQKIAAVILLISFTHAGIFFFFQTGYISMLLGTAKLVRFLSGVGRWELSPIVHSFCFKFHFHYQKNGLFLIPTLWTKMFLLQLCHL